MLQNSYDLNPYGSHIPSLKEKMYKCSRIVKKMEEKAAKIKNV